MLLAEFKRTDAPAVVRERFIDGIVYENHVLPGWFFEPLMEAMVNYVRRHRVEEGKRVNHWLFDGLGKLCREIRNGAASWKALDIIYNYRGGGSIIDRLWIGHMRNAQAVRNRKRQIVKQIRSICEAEIARKGSVNILSLASGSAQAVFEAVAGLPNEAVKILLIDFDREAGPYALEIAQRCGLEKQVGFKCGNLLKFDRRVMIGDFRPDIVEMAGLLDYLENGEAVNLMRRIRAVLPPGGHFVTCHIHDNPERDFMTEVIEWGRDDGKQRPMLYRSPAEFVKLVQVADFKTISVSTEPHRIHSVIVAND